jgi:ABC-type bacteriocin/lantibiotic exporter with double-glycine peptidase domain
MSSNSPTVLKITLATVFLLLLSCAASRDFGGQESARMLQSVPFYQLKANQCGPASLASVLNFWGVAVSPAEVADEIYSQTARGTLSLDMLWYAEGRGLRARQYKGSVDEIKHHVDRGHPLIVMVDYGFWIYTQNHFMVVVGYTEEGVIVNSGNGYPELLAFEDFLRGWSRTNFWTLLITPKF